MRSRWLIIFLSLIWDSATSQTFTNATGGGIQEVGMLNYYPVEVSGLPATIDSMNFGLISVCWTILHSYDGDLDILIESPDGVLLELSNNNGDEFNNYIGTCVQENATDGEISAAEAAFNGSYFPENSINTVNNGSDPNGTWFLVVIDESPTETGSVEEFSITFGNSPPPTHIGGPCSTSNATGCSCADGSDTCDLLPNMINSENYILNNWTEKQGKITMGVATPNIGYGPLEMHTTGSCFCDTIPVVCNVPCPDGNFPKENVIQTIYRKNGISMSSYDVSAGTMSYHPTHGHIHVDNWTHNSLRIRGENPDARTWPIVSQSDKQSFCLINLGSCSDANEYCVNSSGQVIDKDNTPNGGLGSVTGCDYHQGIYVGKYDAYDQYLDGQEIFFDDLCNGLYYLVSITDPNNVVQEMSEEDNWVAVPLEFKKQDADCCQGAFHADTTTGFAPFEVLFIDSTVPVADSWIWDFGDGNTSADQFPKHIYNDPGMYSVMLITTTSTGCTDTVIRNSYISVSMGTGFLSATSHEPLKLEVAPNPFQEATTIGITSTAITPVHLFVTDLSGRVVKDFFNGVHPSGNRQYFFHAAKMHLPGGVYLVHAEVNGKAQVAKLVKY